MIFASHLLVYLDLLSWLGTAAVGPFGGDGVELTYILLWGLGEVDYLGSWRMVKTSMAVMKSICRSLAFHCFIDLES